MRLGNDIKVVSNFEAWLKRPDGRVVEGSKREGHNVFTDVGRDWLAHLVAWHTVGTPDIPWTQRRVRWIGVGTGSQAETAAVVSLAVPALVTPSDYLAALQLSEISGLSSVKFTKEFGVGEISFGGLPVPITEAALYVDCSPAISSAVDDDQIVVDFTLNPQSGTNPPVAYHTFDVINKTADFSLIVHWTFTF